MSAYPEPRRDPVLAERPAYPQPVRGPWLRGPYRRRIPRGERLLLRVLVLLAAVVTVRVIVGVIW